MTRSLILAALAVAGCAHLEPSFENSQPRLARVSGCPVDLQAIALRSSGPNESVSENSPGLDADRDSEMTSSVSYEGELSPDFGFRSDDLAAIAEVPDGAIRLGAIRTHDMTTTGAEYRALWCAYARSQPEQACVEAAHDKAELLRSALRSEAYALQGDLVHDVRCFGRNTVDGTRVWCEGVAYLTEEHARSSCNDVLASL